MPLSQEEGALRLYELFFGDRDRQQERSNTVFHHEAGAQRGEKHEDPQENPREGGDGFDQIRQIPVAPASIISAAKPKKKRQRCRECGRIRPNAGRGLCGRCYYRVRKAESGKSN
jgi:hypothetical protein